MSTSPTAESISLTQETKIKVTKRDITNLHSHIVASSVSAVSFQCTVHYLFARHLLAHRNHWRIRRRRFNGIISQANRRRSDGLARAEPAECRNKGSLATTPHTFSSRQKPNAKINDAPPAQTPPEVDAAVYCSYKSRIYKISIVIFMSIFTKINLEHDSS